MKLTQFRLIGIVVVGFFIYSFMMSGGVSLPGLPETGIRDSFREVFSNWWNTVDEMSNQSIVLVLVGVCVVALAFICVPLVALSGDRRAMKPVVWSLVGMVGVLFLFLVL